MRLIKLKVLAKSVPAYSRVVQFLTESSRKRRHRMFAFTSRFARRRLLQSGRESGDHLEQIADNGVDARAGLTLVERDDRRLRIAIEGEDDGPGRDVVQVLRRTADADCQDDLGIDAYT